MKRLALRLSVLAAVLFLGWIAIAYAQRETDPPESPATDTGNSILTMGPQSNPLRGTRDNLGLRESSPPIYPPRQLPSVDNPTFPRAGVATAETRQSNESPLPMIPPDPFGIQTTRESSNPERPVGTAAGLSPAPDTYTVDHRRQSPYAAPSVDQNGPADLSSASLVNDYSAVAPPTNPPTKRLDDSSDLGQRVADPRLSPTSLPNEGTGQPAIDRKLDGQQTPQLSIQKVAPEEIQVGKPATFRVEVKNTGTVTAQDVEIRDQIPQGTQLIDTKPPASRGTRGELVWSLGKIEPGGGASVEMQIMPTAEGEIGSIAMVHFSASASVRTHATKPELVLNVSAPKTLMIEGEMTMSITVSNPGTGVATGVVLEEHVPPCLQHPAGAELEYEVGDLAPNESKTLDLQLIAVRPGQGNNRLIARADAVADVKKELPIEVVAPELKIEMSGPKSRYLERQATYELAVSNPGTAPARDVRFLAELPHGLKFISANKNAHYDPETRTVQWALAELPTGETGTVQLTTLPVEIGRHALQFRGTAEKALTVKQEEQILVDGIAAIRFEVVDVKDPIEVGAETTYEIRVLNQGSKEATRLSLEATLPPGLQVVAAEGPDGLNHRVQGNHLVFDPLSRLSPKVDVTYRIRVQGRQPGDQRIRVQLTAAELQSPVIKEESTRVFSDR